MCVILYSVARQQETHSIHDFLKMIVEHIEYT